MKVTHNPSPGSSPIEKNALTDKVTSKAPLSRGADEVSPNRGATVEISEQAQLMKHAADVAKAAPDVRADRVADLKRRIKEGTYEVNSETLADRIIKEHLDDDFGKNTF